jgi:hypothetical protein
VNRRMKRMRARGPRQIKAEIKIPSALNEHPAFGASLLQIPHRVLPLELDLAIDDARIAKRDDEPTILMAMTGGAIECPLDHLRAGEIDDVHAHDARFIVGADYPRFGFAGREEVEEIVPGAELEDHALHSPSHENNLANASEPPASL